MTTEPEHGLKRYRLSHNRDFIPIMAEALESQFIRIPEQEWVKASEADALIAAKDAEIARLRAELAACKTGIPSKFIPFTSKRVGCLVCGSEHGHGGLICPFSVATSTAEGQIRNTELGMDAARSKQEKRDE